MSKPTKYIVSHAPGHSRESLGKFGAYDFKIIFPVDIDPIDAGTMIEAICEQNGWEYAGAQADRSFDRTFHESCKGVTLDEEPFADFTPEDDPTNA